MEKKKIIRPQSLRLVQVFGSKDAADNAQYEDFISVVKFDKTGQFLALGDHDGRVIIFKNENPSKASYSYFAQFQTHFSEIDPLQSLSIEEKVKSVEWLSTQEKYLKFLTCNSKSIKLWKVFERKNKEIVKHSGKDYTFPKFAKTQPQIHFHLQKNFPEKHHEAILNLSSSKNEQFLLSADCKQGFLWDLEKPEKPYVVADIEDFDLKMTCLKYHPISDNMFAYGTNKGCLNLSDVRCPMYQKAIKFQMETYKTKSVFEDICRISDVNFMKNGRYIGIRDYLTVKIWDISNPKIPIVNSFVEETMKSKLCELFEKDCVEDKFSVLASGDSKFLMTGNYNNCFHLMNIEEGQNYQFKLNYKKETDVRKIEPKVIQSMGTVDTNTKTIAMDYHPKKNIAAVASKNSFFIYSL